jgi:hypothetical protein
MDAWEDRVATVRARKMSDLVLIAVSLPPTTAASMNVVSATAIAQVIKLATSESMFLVTAVLP